MSTTGRRLLFAKLLHFTSCLANAAWGRYAGIYLNTQRHLTPLENGVVRGGCACTDRLSAADTCLALRVRWPRQHALANRSLETAAACWRSSC